MISWQKILREETFSLDFELISDNDMYIVDGVRSSYKADITASYDQVKEILDGAFKAGFKLAKRRFTSKTVYVLIKSYRNAHIIFQLSIQKNVLLACEVSYGISGDELYPNSKKSRYFTTIYNTFDKTLPLDFMDVNIDKNMLSDEVHIQIRDEFEWSEYFDYMYSFMVVMLDKLNDSADVFLEESLQESKEEEKQNPKIESFIKEVSEFDSRIRIDLKTNIIKEEYLIFIEWRDGYYEVQDEIKNRLNTIITNFYDSIKEESSVDLHRSRTNKIFNRTIFIKYK